METWLVVVIGILCVFAGMVCGDIVQKALKKGIDGILVVDKATPNQGGDAYMQTMREPQSFRKGERIVLQVEWFTERDLRKTERSQGKQS